MQASENIEQDRVWVAITGRGKTIVLAGLRGPDTNNSGKWGLFGGRIDPGETPTQAAAREVFEEIGVRINEADLKQSFMQTRKGVKCYWFTLPRSCVNFAEIRFTREVCDFEFGNTNWILNGDLDLHYSLALYLAHRTTLEQTLKDQVKS